MGKEKEERKNTLFDLQEKKKRKEKRCVQHNQKRQMADHLHLTRSCLE